MSNHTSQRTINLHHRQVNAGRERRQLRQDARMRDYLIGWAEARQDYWLGIGSGLFLFVYSMIAIPFYLGYIL